MPMVLSLNGKGARIVLAETRGGKASYTLKSDDLYVRAKVVSGKASAWTQPLFA